MLAHLFWWTYFTKSAIGFNFHYGYFNIRAGDDLGYHRSGTEKKPDNSRGYIITAQCLTLRGETPTDSVLVKLQDIRCLNITGLGVPPNPELVFFFVFFLYFFIFLMRANHWDGAGEKSDFYKKIYNGDFTLHIIIAIEKFSYLVEFKCD